MTSIHFFGHPTSDFLGAVHSCGTWRKAVHKPVPFEGGEMLGSYKQPHTGQGGGGARRHLITESRARTKSEHLSKGVTDEAQGGNYCRESQWSDAWNSQILIKPLTSCVALGRSVTLTCLRLLKS